MKITFIGAGNMGGAIARGLVCSGFLTPSELNIIDRDPMVCELFKKLGAAVDKQLSEIVVVAVKPWQMVDVAPLLKDYVGVVISIAGRVTLDELKRLFPMSRIARVIPNTAVEELCGASFICSHDRELTDQVATIFKPLGSTFIVDESQMDACTSLGSCGLAFALRYARAAMSAAVEMGVKPAQAQKIIASVLRGTAALLEKGSNPEAEIDKITTPAGITIKGLNAMEQAGFTNAVIRGLIASK